MRETRTRALSEQLEGDGFRATRERKRERGGLFARAFSDFSLRSSQGIPFVLLLLLLQLLT